MVPRQPAMERLWLRSLLVVSLMLAGVSLVTAEAKPTETTERTARGELIELKTNTLHQVFTSGERWLLQFYSRTCVPCQTFADNYRSVGDVLMSKDPKFHVAKIEGPDAILALKQFQIQSYPAFVLIDEHNKVYYFTGMRSFVTLIRFAEEKKHGRSMNAILFGPSSIAWRFLSQIYATGYSLAKRIEAKELSPSALFFLCGGFFTLLVALFALLLGVSTAPPKSSRRTKRE